jgi:hypothetical protein
MTGSSMVDVQSKYVVHNTFVEILDEPELAVDCPSLPAFRRRRGSSFFRCSSEPLRTSRNNAACNAAALDLTVDSCSTEDEGSTCDRSTPQLSPASSRASSPAPSLGPCEQFPIAVPRQIAALETPQHCLVGQFHNVMFGYGSGQTMFLPALQQQTGCNTSLPRSSGLVPHLSQVEQCDNRGSCHLIWCDHRAFKDSSAQLKNELEARSGASVKTHKTADNCIRLFRKKQRAQGRPPCAILVSWANAQALLDYLQDAGSHVNARVVVLCDARSCRKGDSSVTDFEARYPELCNVATSWEDALDAVSAAVAALTSTA